MALKIGDVPGLGDVPGHQADSRAEQGAAEFQKQIQLAQAVPVPAGPLPLPLPPQAIPGTSANQKLTNDTTHALLQGFHNAGQNLGYAAEEWKKGNYGNAASVFFPFIPHSVSSPQPSTPPVQGPKPQIVSTPVQELKPQIVSTPIQNQPTPQAVGGGLPGETMGVGLPGFVPPALPTDSTKVESRRADEERDKWRARGIPDTDLGPSGKPKRHFVEHSTKKAAVDAAREKGKGQPMHHATPKKGDPHYHATDGTGTKDRVHHSYPKSQR